MINRFVALVRGKVTNDKGQAMVEYGLLVTLISIAAIAVLLTIGPKLVTIFTDTATALTR